MALCTVSSRCDVLSRLIPRMMKFMSYLWRYLGLAPQWHGYGPIFGSVYVVALPLSVDIVVDAVPYLWKKKQGRQMRVGVCGDSVSSCSRAWGRGFVSLCYGGAAVGMVHTSCWKITMLCCSGNIPLIFQHQLRTLSTDHSVDRLHIMEPFNLSIPPLWNYSTVEWFLVPLALKLTTGFFFFIPKVVRCSLDQWRPCYIKAHLRFQVWEEFIMFHRD